MVNTYEKIMPNFLCVGAQKAGTTTLHDILKQHPDIYLPDSKEAHFFDIDSHYERGIDWWLETFFSTSKNEKSAGAITPEYLYYKDVPSRILETIGQDVKIIIVLRHPVTRAFSHYLMSKRRGYEDLSFDEAINLEDERISKGEFEKNHYSYLSRSMYLGQVKRYFDIFPRENILVIKFEDDLITNTDTTISKILNFLDLKDMPLKTKIKSNKATRPRFKIISKLINEKGVIKNFLSLFIKSSNIKIIINQLFNTINQTSKDIPTLSETDKVYYLNKYFLEEIKSLEKLIGLNLKAWYK